jgi:hypothetical protein
MSIQKLQLKYQKDIITVCEEYKDKPILLDRALTTIIRKIARDTDLLTFDERLENSKEKDLY